MSCSLYDFIIDREISKRDCLFSKQHPALINRAQKNDIVINEWLHGYHYQLEIVARKYDVSYKAGVYDFNVIWKWKWQIQRVCRTKFCDIRNLGCGIKKRKEDFSPLHCLTSTTNIKYSIFIFNCLLSPQFLTSQSIFAILGGRIKRLPVCCVDEWSRVLRVMLLGQMAKQFSKMFILRE